MISTKDALRAEVERLRAENAKMAADNGTLRQDALQQFRFLVEATDERDAARAEVERLRCSCHQTQDEAVRNRTCPVHRGWIARFAEIEQERDAARAALREIAEAADDFWTFNWFNPNQNTPNYARVERFKSATAAALRAAKEAKP